MNQKLIDILNTSHSINTILKNGDKIKLPDWYIAGGIIPTVVWNYLSGYNPEEYVNDIDLIYYDKNDISQEAEENASMQIKDIFPDVKVPIDVANQAGVHAWYRDKSGNEIKQYTSVEQGINMWLSVTAVGIRRINGRYEVHAPFGLDDLFNMRVKPNRRIISADHYKEKTEKWKKQWPEITVFDYDS